MVITADTTSAELKEALSNLRTRLLLCPLPEVRARVIAEQVDPLLDALSERIAGARTRAVRPDLVTRS